MLNDEEFDMEDIEYRGQRIPEMAYTMEENDYLVELERRGLQSVDLEEIGELE